ncbi:MAG: SAM-dependent methyltransferase [Gemmatimonadota bacterium]
MNGPGGQAYRALMESGLYDELVEAELLVPHEVVSTDLAAADGAVAVLRPERIPFISYPYEWSFGQLRAAAITTLRIQQRAMDRGMGLTDATPFNIQFVGRRPVLVDTLSLVPMDDGEPWIAYHQFCTQFLAPLRLQARLDPRLSGLLRSTLDGVPLDMASRMLPRRTWANLGDLMHIHLHARSIRRHAGAAAPDAGRTRASARGIRGIVEHLLSHVEGTAMRRVPSVWEDYEASHSYEQAARTAKLDFVSGWVQARRPSVVWDLGANTGVFSRVAAQGAGYVVSLDFDANAVEQNFSRVSHDSDEDGKVLPLCMNLMNPSPDLGWGLAERKSLTARGPADLCLALALVHHLAISGNVPLPMVAAQFAEWGRSLIVEWVPKSDAMVQRLLASRVDVFDEYTEEGFQQAFSSRFHIVEREPVPESERVLYAMERRG